MKFGALPVLFAALGLAAASQAAAQPIYNPHAPSQLGDDVVVVGHSRFGGEVRSEPIGFRDLNLATRAGAYTLLGRIQSAAERVCSPPFTLPDNLRDIANYQRCYRRAVGRAVHDTDAPTLEHVYYDSDPGAASYGG